MMRLHVTDHLFAEAAAQKDVFHEWGTLFSGERPRCPIGFQSMRFFGNSQRKKRFNSRQRYHGLWSGSKKHFLGNNLLVYSEFPDENPFILKVYCEKGF